MANREKVVIENRYGQHGGKAKVKQPTGSNGKKYRVDKYRPTAETMHDKCRYNQTRFAGEDNTAYTEGGEAIEGGYDAAYEHTAEAASQIEAETGNAYIYDSTINPGNGAMSDEAMHRMVSEYKERLEEQGYRVEGMQYTIHRNTAHTHVHVMYATQKTIQYKHDRSNKKAMRPIADRLWEQEQHQQREAAREQAQRRDVDNSHSRDTGGVRR